MDNIAAKSVIHPNAKIGPNVYIGPFSFIDDNVEIGEGSWIGPNVTIFSGARIGSNVKIFPGAVIAGIPQDLKFAGEDTTAEIGDGSIIREYVTINRGTKAAAKTVVGKNCLLMAYVHIAHDCILGDNIVLANNVNLAGHVEVQDWVIIEGQVGVQQFTRLGQHSFVAGGSLVRKDVPPYIRAAREPLAYIGINRIGLERRSFEHEVINNIQDIYRYIFVRGMNLSNALQHVEQIVPPSPERDHIISFIQHSKNGIVRSFQNVNGSKIYED